MALNGGSFISGAGGTKSVLQQNTQNAVLPSARVATFRNTNISGVLNNQSPLVNQQGQTQNPADAVDPATASLDRQQSMVTGGNNHSNLMAMYAQVKANKEAARAAAAAPQVTATYRPQQNQATSQPRPSAPIQSTYSNDGALSASRNKVLNDAASYLGTPYRLGGLSRQAIDCSGLVIAVYAQMGFKVPHNARIQGQIMGQRTSVSNLRPGDLVAWNDGSHIAIYAGNGMIIEAANPRVGTVKRKLWSNAVYGVRVRLPGE